MLQEGKIYKVSIENGAVGAWFVAAYVGTTGEYDKFDNGVTTWGDIEYEEEVNGHIL